MLPPTASIKDAMDSLTRTGGGIILVTDHDRRLLGVVVDSDIRKAILTGYSLSAPLSEFMTFKPFTLGAGITREEIRAEFKRYPRAYIPIIDDEGRVTDLARLDDFFKTPEEQDNWVVIMAGGLGTRLRPVTNEVPKPMVSVGDKPVLETIIERFLLQGFNKFMIAVNHFGEQIQKHFGNGSHWNAHIDYIEEKNKMGTAGALALINLDLKDTFIVMNADLITRVDFVNLLNFHKTERSKATICLREYNIRIPFGVIDVKDFRMQSIDEKPVQRFFVNGGIYAFEPEILKLLKEERYMDMPELLNSINSMWPRGISCFPITEYWLDIGQVEDYERAQREYAEVFKP